MQGEESIETAEDQESYDDLLPLYNISSWGADYTVEVLVGKLNKDDIFIPPFQRKFVWTLSDASRFIESLIFGLPVPGIFLSREKETNRMLVIDGQQRLTSLRYFYDGVFSDTGREFRLTGVHQDLLGKTYKTLEPELRRRLDDTVIHATIVKQESPEDDGSSIYQIFERLNTGGKRLSAQEIRSAVYYGELVTFLESLNTNQDWRAVFGKANKYMKDHEYILRFLALLDCSDSYSRPMKGFLNKFMAKHKVMVDKEKDRLSGKFIAAIGTSKAIGGDVFRPKGTLNLAVFDSVLIGISKRLDSGSIGDTSALRKAYNGLLAQPAYQVAISPNATDDQKVKARIELATQAFQSVK